MEANTIICGEAKAVMSGWPAESVNCCISSPPFWALRDYGWDVCTLFGTLDDFVMPRSAKKRSRWWIMIRWRAHLRGGIFSPNKKTWIGALGLEPTFELYIEHLCGVYDEVKRVLRKDGTCWVNLGDTYWGGKGQSGRCDHNLEERVRSGRCMQRREYTLPTKHCPQDGKHEFVQAKSLCLIPQRFAIEMVNRGWILRNVIIWHKPNPMPSSAKDRFTVDFEYVYFFTKSKRYWFEPQYEAQSETSHPRYARGLTEPPPADPDSKELNRPGYENWRETTPIHKLPLGRNKRTVWTIPTQAFPEAHFATFPEKLVEPMIKAGCPEFVCTKCGKGREKIYDTEYEFLRKSDIKQQPKQKARPDPFGFRGAVANALHHFKGYTDCGCGAEFRSGIVLDPFAGRARPVWSLPKTEGIGLVLSLNRSISKWRNAA